jgi:hypothetical protein
MPVKPIHEYSGKSNQMQSITHRVKFENVQGQSFNVGTATLTPFSRRLRLGSLEAVRPNKGFTLLFHQPTAIVVEDNGRKYRVSIRDYQKIIMITLWLFTAVCVVISLCLSCSRSGLRNSMRTTLLE